MHELIDGRPTPAWREVLDGDDVRRALADLVGHQADPARWRSLDKAMGFHSFLSAAPTHLSVDDDVVVVVVVDYTAPTARNATLDLFPHVVLVVAVSARFQLTNALFLYPALRSELLDLVAAWPARRREAVNDALKGGTWSTPGVRPVFVVLVGRDGTKVGQGPTLIPDPPAPNPAALPFPQLPGPW